MSFPGRAFPVAELYLEAALALVGPRRYRVDPSADWSRSSQAAQRRARQKQAQLNAHGNSSSGGGGGGGGGSGSSSESGINQMFGESSRDVARRFPRLPATAHEAMAQLDEDAVNVTLIVELCCWYKNQGGVTAARRACRRAGLGGSGSAAEDKDKEEGDSDAAVGGNSALAVLVFLPGTREIADVQEALQRSRDFGALDDATQRAWILPLHGALPPDEQRRVFERPPAGAIKVVLATNVAETSVTIDDVGFVVDSGRVKEERYYPDRRMAALEDVWVSRSSAKQRRGRAGRVRPGLAVHLFPSDAKLAQHAEPEVRRVALEQLVLRIKALALPGSAAAVCDQLVEPPEQRAVAAAVRELAGIGALKLGGVGRLGIGGGRSGSVRKERKETLTALGAALTQLPVDAPRQAAALRREPGLRRRGAHGRRGPREPQPFPVAHGRARGGRRE